MGNGCTREFRLRHFLLDHPDTELFVTSQWSWPGIAYVVYRWVVCVYFLVWLVLAAVLPYAGGDQRRDRLLWFAYLTSWAYITLNISNIISAATATSHYVNTRRNTVTKYHQIPWYIQLQWAFYNIMLVSAPFVSFGFWAFQWKYGGTLSSVTFHTHALNTVYVLIDLFIVAVPLRLFHFWFLILFGTLYVSFALLYQAGAATDNIIGPVIYPPLDFFHNPGISALFVFVGLLSMMVLWFGFFGLYVLRAFLSKQKCQCGRDYVGEEEVEVVNYGMADGENPAFDYS